MPAASADTMTLPRFAVHLDAKLRRVSMLTTAPGGFEGEGFPVRRAFAGIPLADLDPFVHMDQMGEVEYAPGEPKGTPWHPHRGFETFTYLIDGQFIHQDSMGGGGANTEVETPGGGWVSKKRRWNFQSSTANFSERSPTIREDVSK